MDELELMLLEHNYDMVGISETWLDESHDWAVNLQGYSLFRNDALLTHFWPTAAFLAYIGRIYQSSECQALYHPTHTTRWHLSAYAQCTPKAANQFCRPLLMHPMILFALAAAAWHWLLQDIVPVYQIKGISKLVKLCLPKVQCCCDSLTSPPSERQKPVAFMGFTGFCFPVNIRFNALLMSVASLLANPRSVAVLRGRDKIKAFTFDFSIGIKLNYCISSLVKGICQQYQVGQLYSVAEASKNETGGGEGIEVLKNEPYEKDGEKGQYTHKIYHLKSKVPGFVKMFAPEGSLVFHEKAWNAYPYCRTKKHHIVQCLGQGMKTLDIPRKLKSDHHTVKRFVIETKHRLHADKGTMRKVSARQIHWTKRAAAKIPLQSSKQIFEAVGASGVPRTSRSHYFQCYFLLIRFPKIVTLQNEYMKEDFFIKIETWHKPDVGTQENVHCLDPNVWKTVEVVHIDIADRSQVEPSDYKADEDPAIFESFKTKRGPLGPNWKKELANKEDCPRMCAYKLVTIKFRWWGLQNKVEHFIQKQEKRIFTNFHRQLFCWIDKWIDLTMEDIRRMEDETQKELEAIWWRNPVDRFLLKNDVVVAVARFGLRNQGQVRGTSAANDE
ncbi:unnamed protein product [Ranitomeya imitator]|uniref:Phosphatidylinositol transfer protein beta isoform n=1 Tax=Ranitomeya imitator TaxID=111125 RepID=A0ABN9LQR3_9NEOB|nr:unnamed protein product [Ranitomeya imitator]